jgi:hypothetical protein
MSTQMNLIYVSLDDNNIAKGITESYTLPPGNNVSLGQIIWDEVDRSILGKYWDGEYWVDVGLQPYPSWTLDKDLQWIAPIPIPDDGKEYFWDEENQQWIELPQ